MSHELVEAATDPFPASDPAFYGADQANLVWTLTTGGEVADMGKRSQRYGMVVKDGKVEQLHIEPGPGLNVCSAESMLGKL